MKGHPSSHDFPDLQSILGSAAKVKRLWSVDKQVTTGVRSLMFPSISETFIFLKANVRSRDAQRVSEAIHTATFEHTKQKEIAHFYMTVKIHLTSQRMKMI